MLKFLLDEQISYRVAQGLRRRNAQVVVYSLLELEGGQYLSAPDQELLRAAVRLSLTMVTYDLKTFVPLLKSCFEQGISHSGVVLVEYSTIRPDDFGNLVTALEQLCNVQGNLDWTDRVVHLTRKT